MMISSHSYVVAKSIARKTIHRSLITSAAQFLEEHSLVRFHIDDETTTPCLQKYWNDGAESRLKGRIGTITLNSPKTFNALTVEMGRDFKALCQQLTYELMNKPSKIEGDAESLLHANNVQAIVVTGQGKDAFSAGGNLEWLNSLRHNTLHENTDLMLQFYSSFQAVRQLPVPVIAALHGPAMGAGACLALACDLRTAEPKHKILGMHFSKLGIHAGMGGTHLLQSALGAPSAKLNEVLLLGKILSGQECFDLDLVNRLTDDAKAAAYDLAADIALNQHPVAIRTMLQTIRSRQDEGLQQALQREAMAQAICYSQDDWGEGLNAIAQKREPKFDPYHKE